MRSPKRKTPPAAACRDVIVVDRRVPNCELLRGKSLSESSRPPATIQQTLIRLPDAWPLVKLGPQTHLNRGVGGFESPDSAD